MLRLAAVMSGSGTDFENVAFFRECDFGNENGAVISANDLFRGGHFIFT